LKSSAPVHISAQARRASFKGVGVVKLYRIMKRHGAWQVLAGEPEHSVAASEERDGLTRMARHLAMKHDAQVRVFDAAGRLEVVYTFTAGRESVERSGKLRLVRPNPQK
jgi:hypothetical protein